MLFKYEEGIRTTDKMLFSLALWDTEYFGRERSIVEVVSLMKRAKLCNSTKVRMRHLCHLFVYTQLLLHNDNQDASICKAVAFIPSVDIPQLDFSFAFTHLKLHYLLSRCSVQLPWQQHFHNHWAVKIKVPKQSEKIAILFKTLLCLTN